MAFETIGVICFVGPVVTINEKFRKRELVLELSTVISDVIYSDYAKMQLLNAACDMVTDDVHTTLMRYVVGDKVKVTWAMKGNRNVKDGVVSFFNNLNVFRIEDVAQFAPAPVRTAPPSNQVRQENFDAQQKEDQWYQQGFHYGKGDVKFDDLPF